MLTLLGNSVSQARQDFVLNHPVGFKPQAASDWIAALRLKYF